MATPGQSSPDALNAEILAEARRQCGQILSNAQQEAAALLSAATAAVDKIRGETLGAARVEAARRRELALAEIPVEAVRLRASRIEAILENIRQAAHQKLQAHTFDGREAALALAAEAIRRMPGSDFVVKISPADHAAGGDRLVEEILRRTGRSSLNLSVTADPAITDGGAMVEDAAGIRYWDNRVLSRLARLWPELRRQIATQASLVERNGPAGGAHE